MQVIYNNDRKRLTETTHYMIDYTKITHEGIETVWSNFIASDSELRNMSEASVYKYLQQMIAGCTDLIAYYIQRTAEESTMSTAVLDSSVIRLARNLGYNPQRAKPASADVYVKLKGPWPSTCQAGDVIWLSNRDLTFKMNNLDFVLDRCYSYTLTEEDIVNGASSTWSKTVRWAVDSSAGYSSYMSLDDSAGYSAVSSALTKPRVLQGTLKTVTVLGSSNKSQVGRAYQSYDVDDTEFSNMYGQRDPYGWNSGDPRPLCGTCRVGIGQTEEEAFSESGVFTVVDDSVEYSLEVLDTDRIVCITTNPDKTVRLQFGNGVTSARGLENSNQNLYIQYLSTKGRDGIFLGAEGSQLTPSGSIYASGRHRSNISSNIEIVAASGVAGGENFESRDSVKRSAYASFYSSRQLMTVGAVVNRLKSLVSPIEVSLAAAVPERQVEDESESFQQERANIILYCLMSSIYQKERDASDGQSRYTAVNVFDQDSDTSGLMLYPDYDSYISAVIDYLTFLLRPKEFLQNQIEDESQLGLNCASIRSELGDDLPIGTYLCSIPPCLQYFDLTGTVWVERGSDLSAVTLDLENRLYAHLADTAEFGGSIYKSDLLRVALDTDLVSRVSLDFKVSEWIAGGNPDEYLLDAGSLTPYSTEFLSIPTKSSDGEDLREVISAMTGKFITIVIGNSDGTTLKIIPTRVSYDEDYIYIYAANTLTSYIEDLESYTVTLKVYSSGSSYSSQGEYLYCPNLYSLAKKWMSTRSTQSSTSGAPIDYPYTVAAETSGDSDDTEAMTEKSLRYSGRGRSANGIETDSSEISFFYYLKEAVQNGEIGESTVEEEFKYFYPIMKPIFTDYCLDDNNDITRLTSNRELAVVRLDLTYRYK